MTRYDKYKDCDIEWIGKIPEEWEINRNKYLFSIRKSAVGKKAKDYLLLSLTLKGIIARDMENPKGKFPAEFDTYQEVNKEDLVFCLFDVEETPRAVGYAEVDGMITGAYTVIKTGKNIFSKYLYYYYLALDQKKRLSILYTGLRNVIRTDTFLSIKSLVPPLETQKKIVDYLDKKQKQSEEFISKQNKIIELLKEQKKAIINKAVTKGINTNVKMKDSGVEWLGEIPEHWEVKKLKDFANFVNRGTTPKYIESSDYMVVNQATFSKGYFDETDMRFHYSDKINKEKGKLEYKDIIMASTGGGILGKIGLFEKQEGIYIADSHVTIIRDSKKRFIPEYIYYFFSINYELINGCLAQGSTNQTELQRTWLRQMLLPYPDVEEQKIIVNYIEEKINKIDIAISKAEQEVKLAKEYMESLIFNVVTGQIKVD